MHVSIPRPAVIKNKISLALGLISLASFPLERTMHRKVMLIVLSGVVLWTCATPGIPEKNVAETRPGRRGDCGESQRAHVCRRATSVNGRATHR